MYRRVELSEVECCLVMLSGVKYGVVMYGKVKFSRVKYCLVMLSDVKYGTVG